MFYTCLIMTVSFNVVGKNRYKDTADHNADTISRTIVAQATVLGVVMINSIVFAVVLVQYP